MARLALVAVLGVTDPAVAARHAGGRLVVGDPAGGVRHDRLVTTLAGRVVVTRAAHAFAGEIDAAVRTTPLCVLVVGGDYRLARRVGAGLLASVAGDAELRLVAHRAVGRVGKRPLLVLALDERLGVVRRHEIELLGVALPALVTRRHETLLGVIEAVTAVAREHVGPRRAVDVVAEGRVARGAGVVASQVLGVGEDEPSRLDVVDVGMAVHALGHRGRAGGIDLHRGATARGIDHGVVRVRHLRDLDLLLLVARVAVLRADVTHHAAVHVGLRGVSVRLLRPVLGVRLRLQRD